MAKYYMNENSQTNGDHEVHVSSCDYLLKVKNRHYLGEFTNCQDALKEAKKRDSKADGCKYCCYPCHTS